MNKYIVTGDVNIILRQEVWAENEDDALELFDKTLQGIEPEQIFEVLDWFSIEASLAPEDQS